MVADTEKGRKKRQAPSWKMPVDGTPSITKECERELLWVIGEPLAWRTIVSFSSMITSGSGMLTISGPSGVGKTRALNQLVHGTRERIGACRVFSLNTYDATECLVNCSRQRQLETFEAALADCDLLVLDNFEDISGLHSTFLTYLSLFQRLLNNGTSIAVAVCQRHRNMDDHELIMRLRNAPFPMTEISFNSRYDSCDYWDTVGGETWHVYEHKPCSPPSV